MKKSIEVVSGFVFAWVALLSSVAVAADDDVAALVVDNDPVPVPVPGVLPLFLVGGLGLALVWYLNRNK